MSDGGDAIRVDLEHAEGHALKILLPYAKKRLRKGVEFGQLRAHAGQRQIWIGQMPPVSHYLAEPNLFRTERVQKP